MDSGGGNVGATGEPRGSLAVGMFWSIVVMLGALFAVMLGVVTMIVRSARDGTRPVPASASRSP